MTARHFPHLADTAATRDALHSYARVLGDWLKACRPRRKHWWHASLRPELYGLTTRTVRGQEDFVVSLDLFESLARVNTATGDEWLYELAGQSQAEFANALSAYLVTAGVAPEALPAGKYSDDAQWEYSRDAARRMGKALTAVSSAMEIFRAGIREECSPIQLWPHHFDLSMVWLPGEKVDGVDPADEESADKQMNFGFVFGDTGIEEPYFYITAYPFPDGLLQVPLPGEAMWQSEGFKGAVASWQAVAKASNPTDALLSLWTRLLDAGREHLVTQEH